MANAAIYARSSKDRADISISAQLRELQALATTRQLEIAETFEDAVESGSSEDRPAFKRLVAALKNPRRGWSTLLVYDTSRLARRRYIAQALKHEAKKRGVTILYAKMPHDIDPIAEIVLEAVFEAMDEVHSLMSREKGLAGMAENVRQGWRAGGRAPLGYVLASHATGAIREGKPVTKSRLALGPDAERVRTYLRARATGRARVVCRREAGLAQSENTLIGVEWNALTYAGHTVWNRHDEGAKGFRKGQKRRPRSEWLITRDTHPALITDVEAAALLSQLETSTVAESVRRARSADSGYLLAGLLFTSDGRPWVGHRRRYYRLKASEGAPGRVVPAEEIDRAVSAQLVADLRSDAFLQSLIDAARAEGMIADPAAPIRAEIAKLEREKDRAARAALTVEAGAETFLQLVGQRSRQLDALRAELAAVEADGAIAERLRGVTPAQVREHLMALGAPTAALEALVERVVLDPDLTCRVRYRCLGMASPRRPGVQTHGLVEVLLRIRAA